MTAQIQTFLHANPVTTTLSRAARWDQLKVHIQDVVRGYCFTFHAQRTGQLRVLRVRASKARAAYVAAPGSQHALDELRHTAAALLQHRQQQAATDALRAGVLLHEYGDQSTYYFHHLHKQRQQATVICHLQQHQDSPVADLCSVDGRQQDDSIIVNFFSADSPTGMYRRMPTDQACTDGCLLTCDLSAQQALLSSLDRRLPSHAQILWCQLLAVLSLICIVWHNVCSVEIVARRRVRLPSCVLFFGEKFCVSLVDLGKTRRWRHL